MASQEEEQAKLWELLAQWVPKDALGCITNEQMDALIAGGYVNMGRLVGLKREDLPNPPFKPAVQNLLLRMFDFADGQPQFAYLQRYAPSLLTCVWSWRPSKALKEGGPNTTRVLETLRRLAQCLPCFWNIPLSSRWLADDELGTLKALLAQKLPEPKRDSDEQNQQEFDRFRHPSKVEAWTTMVQQARGRFQERDVQVRARPGDWVLGTCSGPCSSSDKYALPIDAAHASV